MNILKALYIVYAVFATAFLVWAVASYFDVIIGSLWHPWNIFNYIL